MTNLGDDDKAQAKVAAANSPEAGADAPSNPPADEEQEFSAGFGVLEKNTPIPVSRTPVPRKQPSLVQT